jgi:hypothetical protein
MLHEQQQGLIRYENVKREMGVEPTTTCLEVRYSVVSTPKPL